MTFSHQDRKRFWYKLHQVTLSVELQPATTHRFTLRCNRSICKMPVIKSTYCPMSKLSVEKTSQQPLRAPFAKYPDSIAQITALGTLHSHGTHTKLFFLYLYLQLASILRSQNISYKNTRFHKIFPNRACLYHLTGGRL